MKRACIVIQDVVCCGIRFLISNAYDLLNTSRIHITSLYLLPDCFPEIYRHILGDNCNYKMGMHGPYFDLFLWCVLMDRRDMAIIFWEECNSPLRCALTAACVLRCLSKLSLLNPVERKLKLRSADFFENLGTAIQTQALKQDHDLAMKSMDIQLAFWRKMTILVRPCARNPFLVVRVDVSP